MVSMKINHKRRTINFYVFYYLHVDTENRASTKGENGKHFTVLITLSSLLAISLLINIVLTVTLLRVKGKSSCMKGNRIKCNYNFLISTL